MRVCVRPSSVSTGSHERWQDTDVAVGSRTSTPSHSAPTPARSQRRWSTGSRRGRSSVTRNADAIKARPTSTSGASCCAAANSACDRSCASASNSRNARPARRSRRCATARGHARGADRRRPVYPTTWSSPTSRMGDRHGLTARGSDAATMAQVIRHALGRHGVGHGAAWIPVLYGGSVTSASIGEFLDEPDIDGALVGGASLKVDEMAGIVARAGLTAEAATKAASRHGMSDSSTRAAAAARPRRPRRLRRWRTAGRRRDRAADMPVWRAPARHVGRTHCSTRPRAAVGLPQGQMGNSEVGHLNLGRGPPVVSGSAAHRRGDRGRPFYENPALLHAVQRAARGASAAPVRTASARATFTPSTGTPSRSLELARQARPQRRRRSRASRRPRHAAALGAPASCRDFERRLAEAIRGARIASSAAATTRWTATSAGSASKRATTLSSTARAHGRHRRDAAVAAATRAARTTSSSADVIDGRSDASRDARWRRRSSTSTSAPIGRGS